MQPTLPRAVLAIALALPALTGKATAQAAVDHTHWQTAIQNQGNRTTCIMFAAVAALEARYKRNGLTLDLSEEFCNYVHKTMWLNRDWAPIAAGGSDFRENQVGAFGGGEGTGIARQLAGGHFAVPSEVYMPYRTTPYPNLPAWNNSYWDSQFTTNSFNLDPVNLPRAALTAPVYYSASGYVDMPQPDSTTAIEAVLQAGHDVVWDFDCRGSRGAIWRAVTGSISIGWHSMLIVGYDRTSPNPQDWYFTVKNSWGETSHPGGFTRIGYDYVQAYGRRAGYMTGANTPHGWPELQFLGRRSICFDGWRGILDVYHLPHVMDTWFQAANINIADNRIGTFYDHNGVAHRVNGYVQGKELTFWFKNAPNDNMRWDELRESPTVGRKFRYRVVDDDGEELAGEHYDNPGPLPNPPYGGYARTPSTILANDGYLTPVFNNSLPVDTDQWLGRWRLQTGGFRPDLYVMYRDDNLLTPTEQLTYAGYVCDLVEPGGNRIQFVAKVWHSNPGWMQVYVGVPAMAGQFIGTLRMLNWQRGVCAGYAHTGLTLDQGVYGYRYGTHHNGLVTQFGSGCGSYPWRPYHDVDGHPELGEPLRFVMANTQPGTPAVLAMGLSNQLSGVTPLPFSLAQLGAPTCYVRVDPLATIFGVADVQGYLAVTQTFQHPQLLGGHVYSQYFSLQPAANALGLKASEGVDTLLGGTQ